MLKFLKRFTPPEHIRRKLEFAGLAILSAAIIFTLMASILMMDSSFSARFSEL